MLEVDYANGRVRNPASGKTIEMRKFPAMIEEIFRAGGLPEFARMRYEAEQAGKQA